jgi:hypothetical protein
MALRWFVIDHGRNFDKVGEIKEVAMLLSDAVSAGNRQISGKLP